MCRSRKQIPTTQIQELLSSSCVRGGFSEIPLLWLVRSNGHYTPQHSVAVYSYQYHSVPIPLASWVLLPILSWSATFSCVATAVILSVQSSQSPTRVPFYLKYHHQASSDNLYRLLSYHHSLECSQFSASLQTSTILFDQVKVVTFSQPLTAYTICTKYPYALCKYHCALPLISSVNSYFVWY